MNRIFTLAIVSTLVSAGGNAIAFQSIVPYPQAPSVVPYAQALGQATPQYSARDLSLETLKSQVEAVPAGPHSAQLSVTPQLNVETVIQDATSFVLPNFSTEASSTEAAKFTEIQTSVSPAIRYVESEVAGPVVSDAGGLVVATEPLVVAEPLVTEKVTEVTVRAQVTEETIGGAFVEPTLAVGNSQPVETVTRSTLVKKYPIDTPQVVTPVIKEVETREQPFTDRFVETVTPTIGSTATSQPVETVNRSTLVKKYPIDTRRFVNPVIKEVETKEQPFTDRFVETVTPTIGSTATSQTFETSGATEVVAPAAAAGLVTKVNPQTSTRARVADRQKPNRRKRGAWAWWAFLPLILLPLLLLSVLGWLSRKQLGRERNVQRDQTASATTRSQALEGSGKETSVKEVSSAVPAESNSDSVPATTCQVDYSVKDSVEVRDTARSVVAGEVAETSTSQEIKNVEASTVKSNSAAQRVEQRDSVSSSRVVEPTSTVSNSTPVKYESTFKTTDSASLATTEVTESVTQSKRTSSNTVSESNLDSVPPTTCQVDYSVKDSVETRDTACSVDAGEVAETSTSQEIENVETSTVKNNSAAQRVEQRDSVSSSRVVEPTSTVSDSTRVKNESTFRATDSAPVETTEVTEVTESATQSKRTSSNTVSELNTASDSQGRSETEGRSETVASSEPVGVVESADVETGVVTGRDDFTCIAGIDTAAQQALYDAGYLRFSDIENANRKDLQRVFFGQNRKFSFSDFDKWSSQASLAARGELKVQQRGSGKSSARQERSTSASTVSSTSSSDDLTKIHGIGPKTAGLLRRSGITTFRQLFDLSAERIQQILASGGSKFAMIDSSLWRTQARFAMGGDWKGLTQWQTENCASVSKPVTKTGSTNRVPTTSRYSSSDDLTKIRGIGPATRTVLKENGIHSFAQVAKMSPEELTDLFADKQSRFKMQDTSNWPAEARSFVSQQLSVDDAETELLDEVNEIRSIVSTSNSSANSTSNSRVKSKSK